MNWQLQLQVSRAKTIFSKREMKIWQTNSNKILTIIESFFLRASAMTLVKTCNPTLQGGVQQFLTANQEGSCVSEKLCILMGYDNHSPL
jgi:hypothetical protein